MAAGMLVDEAKENIAMGPEVRPEAGARGIAEDRLKGGRQCTYLRGLDGKSCTAELAEFVLEALIKKGVPRFDKCSL